MRVPAALTGHSFLPFLPWLASIIPLGSIGCGSSTNDATHAATDGGASSGTTGGNGGTDGSSDGSGSGSGSSATTNACAAAPVSWATAPSVQPVPTTMPAVVSAPTLPQPSTTRDIVGYVLQNTAATPSAAQMMTFGQIFVAGKVMPATGLRMTAGSESVAVQMDVHTTNADGSVRMATLTFMAPALAANSALSLMLQSGGCGGGTPVDLTKLAAGTFTVDLAFTGAGAPASVHVDAVAALKTALAGGTASSWLSGALASQSRVDVPVPGSSMHLVFDLTAYADASTVIDAQFDNDIAMGTTGGTLTYGATIVSSGTTTQLPGLTHFQYEQWHRVFASANASALNLQHDPAYLVATGAILPYDLTLGVSASVLQGYAAEMKMGDWTAPFAVNAITQYMGTTGGRPDIGPTTQYNTVWLLTQDATARAISLAQADAAAGIPWHFWNAAASGGGHWLDTDDVPNVWTSPGAHADGTTVLTQGVDGTNNGWSTDSAHQPDLAYDAYLETGSRFYLDQMNAQATWCEDSYWPAAGARNNDMGWILQGNQVRGAAWSFRQLEEASFVGADKSAEQAWAAKMVASNLAWWKSQESTWQATDGQAYGYLPGDYGTGGAMAPWQQDYLESALVEAARQGNADASAVITWRANFMVGRFLAMASGFPPEDGVDYNLAIADSTGALLTTWSAIYTATDAAGQSYAKQGWGNGDYAQLGLESLALDAAILKSADALTAYKWLKGSSAPQIADASFQGDPTFSMQAPDGGSQ